MTEYKTIFSAEEIEKRVCELAGEISNDYTDGKPVFITLLKGAFIFMADLVRHLTIPHEIDFVSLSSYRNGAKRSNVIEVVNHIRADLRDRDVIIIDEIVDSGHTLSLLLRTIGEKRTKSLRVCTLLDKPSARKTDVPVHYSGFKIPDIFVVGYGLDYMEMHRNLPFIAELTPQLKELAITADNRQ
ncbi:MAG: hypoxanthine phosphoribosyltransferase [Candidatus Krumholzibacteriota bacterium]|nr:hypoxanthine phosphoribosyltransferase [Candidatus Krumholzibacteriota bacterium]